MNQNEQFLKITLENTTSKILRLPAVKAQVGFSRSFIYAKIAKGTFPAPIKLSARSVGWLQEEINCWISNHVQQNRSS